MAQAEGDGSWLQAVTASYCGGKSKAPRELFSDKAAKPGSTESFMVKPNGYVRGKPRSDGKLRNHCEVGLNYNLKQAQMLNAPRMKCVAGGCTSLILCSYTGAKSNRRSLSLAIQCMFRLMRGDSWDLLLSLPRSTKSLSGSAPKILKPRFIAHIAGILFS